MFVLAKNAFDKELYEAATPLFGRVIDNFPDSARAQEARLYLGQCYFYRKMYDQAVKALMDYSQAAAQSPAKTPEAWYYWMAEAFFKKNDFSKAYELYQKLLVEYPQSTYAAHAFYSLGWCLFEQGKFKEAEDKFIALKLAFPSSPLAREADSKLAECLYQLKDYTKLKSHLELFFSSVSPGDGDDSALLKFYLAESCYYLGDYPSAIENYTQASKQARDNSLIGLIELGLGWCALKTNAYIEAKAHFDRILETQGEGKAAESALLGKALGLQMGLQAEPALESYEKLIAVAKNADTRLDGLLGKAEVLYSLKRYQEAIAVYDEARVSLGAGVDEAQSSRLSYGAGLVYLKTKDFTNALNEFSSLADKTGDIKIKIASRSKIGEVYLESGDIQKAISAYEGVLRDYPDCQACDYPSWGLAVSLSRLGEYGKAIELFKTIIQKYPQSGLLDEAVFSLGKAYYDSGDYLSSYLSLRNFRDKFPASRLKMEALFLEGLSLQSLKRYQEAYDIFSLGARDSGDAGLSARAELEMGSCLYLLGRIDEALTAFEAIRTRYADSEISRLALFRLASHYLQENKLDLSRRYLLDLIHSRPEAGLLDEAYFALSLCYEREGKYEEALEPLKQVETNKARAYQGMAQAYRAMGKLREAISYYQLSLREKPADASEVQFRLAECLEEAGELKEAMALYSTLQGDDALLVKGLLRCANICENSADLRSALRFYERVAELNVPESKFAIERIETIKGGRE